MHPAARRSQDMKLAMGCHRLNIPKTSRKCAHVMLAEEMARHRIGFGLEFWTHSYCALCSTLMAPVEGYRDFRNLEGGSDAVVHRLFVLKLIDVNGMFSGATQIRVEQRT